jgi:hypothetical protein
VDPDGEKIGEVLEVYVDTATGQPAWLAISTGWFGTRISLVPVTDASPQADDELVSTWSKEQVKNAPHVAADGDLSEDEERELFRYYGVDYIDFHDESSDEHSQRAGMARQRAWEARLRRHQSPDMAAKSPGEENPSDFPLRDLNQQPTNS